MRAISVGIDPADLDQNGDLFDENKLVRFITDALEEQYPDDLVEVMIGWRGNPNWFMGRSWHLIDGQQDIQLVDFISQLDTSDESLYCEK